jgi:hypothetical protein
MMKRGGGQDTSQPGTNVSALAVGVSHLTMALDLKILPRKLMESVVPLQHRKVESQKTYSDCQKRNIGGIHVIHIYAPTGLIPLAEHQYHTTTREAQQIPVASQIKVFWSNRQI